MWAVGVPRGVNFGTFSWLVPNGASQLLCANHRRALPLTCASAPTPNRLYVQVEPWGECLWQGRGQQPLKTAHVGGCTLALQQQALVQ